MLSWDRALNFIHLSGWQPPKEALGMGWSELGRQLILMAGMVSLPTQPEARESAAMPQRAQGPIHDEMALYHCRKLLEAREQNNLMEITRKELRGRVPSLFSFRLRRRSTQAKRTSKLLRRPAPRLKASIVTGKTYTASRRMVCFQRAFSTWRFSSRRQLSEACTLATLTCVTSRRLHTRCGQKARHPSGIMKTKPECRVTCI